MTSMEAIMEKRRQEALAGLWSGEMTDGDEVGQREGPDGDEPQPPNRSALQRPSLQVGIFDVSDAGVFVPDERGDGFVCSRLDVLAQTRDVENANWGMHVQFNDSDGKRHNLSIPAADLTADGAEVCARLRGQGLRIAPDMNRDLMQYLFSANPTAKIRCATRVGWTGRSYLLPDRTYSPPSSEVIVYQPPSLHDHSFNVAGTADDWTREIGTLCAGNSRLVFAASCAFAAPLLTPLGLESGGFHFRGASSTGKTTAIRVAGSVFGGSAAGYIQNWRTTDNALELLAERHNDALLCMDELSQIQAEQAGKSAYMLGNGRGKSRMTDKGGSQRTPAWRLLFLSTGEISLAQHIQSAGGPINAGQAVRFVEIEADAGRDLGLFETIHDLKSPGEFATHLATASTLYYGAPVRLFIERVVADYDAVLERVRLTTHEFVTAQSPATGSGEIARVLKRFGLVAAAGELAAEYGLTGWATGEATNAAVTCFRSWLKCRGSESSGGDAHEGVRRVRAFIESNPGRFQRLRPDSGTDPKPASFQKRAGFKKDTYDKIEDEHEIEYLFLSSCFRDEVCAGLDAEAVARTLYHLGHLRREPRDENHFQVRIRTDDGQIRVYAVRGSILEGE